MKISKGTWAALAALVWAAPAAAGTILVDFGNDSSFRGVSVSNPDVNGRYWNSVHAGAFHANMVDTANAATTMDLQIDAGEADSYNGPAGATSIPPTPSEIAATAFDAAALGALGVTNAVFDFYVNARFQLQGLDANRTYRLTFFGSHKYSTDNTTTYSLCPDNTYGTALAATNLNVQVPGSVWLHNSNKVAVLSGATPQAGGVLYVKFLGTNGNNGYLNAMMVELEKATPTLGVSASRSVEQGTSSVTLTGRVSGANGTVVAANGESVAVTINGVTQNATVSGGAGGFSVAYNTASLTAGTYAITYAYTGNATSLNGATNAATALTVTPRYETVLIDMGNDSAFRSVSVVNPDVNGRYWNSVHGAAYFADMVNKSNVVTRVDLGFDAGSADSYNGPAGATSIQPTPSEIAATAFDAAALGDLGVTNAVFDFYVNARFQVQGLETGLAYRLTFYGAHKYSADDATVYGLCTDNTYATTTTTVTLNVQVPGSVWLHNSNTVAVIAGASPRPDGKLYVAFGGANGHNGYLNAMKVEWEKAAAVISGVSASQSAGYGTASVTLTGLVGAASVPAQAGETVSVTINGVTSNAAVTAGGGFAVAFPVSGLAAGGHTITYAYSGSTVLLGATNAATTLTVTKVTPVIGVRASQSVEAGTASVTLTGVVSGAGGIYPANGSTVGVTINGVTQSATVSGGAGAFSLNYSVSALATGTYTITYAYTGNATSLNGATNNATALVILPVYQTILVDFGRHDGTNGNPTLSPDLNGNHWNNFSPPVVGGTIAGVPLGSTRPNLITVSNAATAIGLELTSSGWLANGRLNGGLFSPNGPSAGLIGTFAVESATEDYFFLGVTETFRISGLYTGTAYRLRFFGTRDSISIRETTYTVGTNSVLLRTSGPDIGSNGTYDGNDDEIASLNNLVPNASGQMDVTLTASGGFGYLGILEISFAGKATPVISGVSASQSLAYGTPSVTLTGVVAAGPVYPVTGETVRVTINGVTSNAAVTGTSGGFSVTFPASAIPAGTHTITYAYLGNGATLNGATNNATTLTVTRHTPSIGVVGSQGVDLGVSSVTLTGLVSAAGPVYPANGETVAVTINGVTQNATIAGGAGAFTLAYDVSSIMPGTYTIYYVYAGNVTALNGASNGATALIITQGGTILVDFGRHDITNGHVTVSPDVNGNYWNNLSSRVGDNIVTNGTRANGLLTTGGAATPVAIEITSAGWKANGRANGGLFSPNGPSGALLSDFAVETATEDYFFAEGAGATETFRISGLNASSTYNLRFFGTRATAGSRQTTYTVGGNSVLLTTSGTGIGNNGVYNGNDDEIVALNNLVPNGSGEINVSVTATTGGFGYIGILEITDNGGFCVDNTPVNLPNPGNQTVLATGSATLSFSVTATDGAGCTAPGLSASGLPAGATFTNSASGNSRTGVFSWTPTGGQVGTYPVRMTATDVNEAGSTSVVMLVYVGQSGEGSNGSGVPNSQTNWHVAITNMQVPTSGNITVVWTSVDGITYDIYQSDQNFGGAMTWTRVVASTNASGSQEDAAVSMSVSQRYFQVVPAGGSPSSNGVWAVIRPTVNASTFTLVSPGTAGDRAFDGALGSNLAQVLTGDNGGVGDNVGDEVFILESNQSWRNLYLSGSNTWNESNGARSTFELAEGQGFQVLRNIGSSAQPRFTGPVGNLGTSTNVITDNSGNGGWNIITFSQGKHIPVSTAFSSLAEGSPEGDWDETQADLILVLNSNGSWRRVMRAGDGTWFDLTTFAAATIQFGPGTAVFYYRQPVGTMRVRF